MKLRCFALTTTLLTFFLAGGAAQSFITNGLVAYYPFNGNANDAEGANNGTIHGGVVLAPDRFGSNNSAYTFNGVDGYIDVGNPVGNNPSNLTATAWVKILSRETSGIVAEDVIITKRQTPYIGSGWPDLVVESTAPNAGAGEIMTEADNYVAQYRGTSQTQTNVWLFICEVSSNNTYQIYVNGILENTVTDSHPLNSVENMYLMHDGALGTYCHGLLDDVRIYNRALSSNEVAQIYAVENTAPIVNPPASCDPPPSGLVSWWRAENDALDSAGTNNGTLTGATTFGSGNVGQGFVFDGNTGSGVALGNPTGLQLQDFTIEGWIKRSSASVASHGSGGVGTIFGCGPGGYYFLMESNGKLDFDKLGDAVPQSGPFITDTNFHHVALTKVGSTVTFYLDGAASSVSSDPTTFTFTTSIGIGYRPDNQGNSFLGTIDELSFYNRALSALEIQAIYNAGSEGKCFTPVPPVITSQPTNQTVFMGQPASFSVSASGTPPLGYQWRFNTTNIVGATNASLLIASVQITNAGTYSVIVSNSVTSILSSNAVLNVNLPSCDPPPSGLVSWWAAEGNAFDQISGNNGTLVGNTTYGPGKRVRVLCWTAMVLASKSAAQLICGYKT